MTRPDSQKTPSSPARVNQQQGGPGTGNTAGVVEGAESVIPGADPASDARVVFGHDEIARALRRMAHEILERNKGGDDLVVLGIPTRGEFLARRLADLMAEVEGRPIPVGTLDVTLYRDDLRRNPIRRMEPTRIPEGGIDDKVVVLADDVLYSGRTIRAALDALADIGRPRAVRLAVLVDRGHRDLPIRADHVGKNLPTSSRERVHVSMSEYDDIDQVQITGGIR